MSGRSPKDLLQGFISGNHSSHKLYEEARDADIELSLGLSLNGRFGVDKRAKKITRSSSIPEFVNPVEDNGCSFAMPMVSTNLARTCSLPTETEEEWRKRKELQTLRRLEAKRKRSEKQRNLKVVKDRNGSRFAEESCEELNRVNGHNGNHHQKVFVKNLNGLFGAGVERVLPPAEVTPPLSQGSIGSHGSGSSAMSEADGQPGQATNKCTEARSPVSVQSLSDCEQKFAVPLGLSMTRKSGSPVAGAIDNNKYSEPTIADNGAKEVGRNVLEDMPCVSTKVDGPNGKRVEGFLYRYRKGEQVRIVCVCHGRFLSPAEFVKHAGGGDVAQPLKHIVVNPPSLFDC